MDMAMDSALAEYHREMLEQYELFFIDMSYGGTSPAFSNTEEHIRNYMNMNFRPYELFEIPVGKDLTGLLQTELICSRRQLHQMKGSGTEEAGDYVYEG